MRRELTGNDKKASNATHLVLSGARRATLTRRFQFGQCRILFATRRSIGATHVGHCSSNSLALRGKVVVDACS